MSFRVLDKYSNFTNEATVNNISTFPFKSAVVKFDILKNANIFYFDKDENIVNVTKNKLLNKMFVINLEDQEESLGLKNIYGNKTIVINLKYKVVFPIQACINYKKLLNNGFGVLIKELFQSDFLNFFKENQMYEDNISELEKLFLDEYYQAVLITTGVSLYKATISIVKDQIQSNEDIRMWF